MVLVRQLKATRVAITVITVLIMSGGKGISAPSGLNLIPTAEVLSRGQISLEMEAPRMRGLWNGNDSIWGLSQIGIGSGLEVGLDWSPRDSHCIFNGKALLVRQQHMLPAVAVGIQGVRRHTTAQPYVVVTRTCEQGSLHAGVMRIEGSNEFMTGIAYPLNRTITFQADYTSGDLNSSSLGTAVRINPDLCITLAYTFGNAASTDDTVLFNLAYTCTLGSCRHETPSEKTSHTKRSALVPAL